MLFKFLVNQLYFLITWHNYGLCTHSLMVKFKCWKSVHRQWSYINFLYPYIVTGVTSICIWLPSNKFQAINAHIQLSVNSGQKHFSGVLWPSKWSNVRSRFLVTDPSLKIICRSWSIGWLISHFDIKSSDGLCWYKNKGSVLLLACLFDLQLWPHQWHPRGREWRGTQPEVDRMMNTDCDV